MDSEVVKSSMTKTEESSKRAGDELESDKSKKQKIDGHSGWKFKRYLSMIKMLQNIDREYLETLWKLVKAKHGNTRPEEDYERVLLVTAAQLQLLSDYYYWKDYADRDEIKDL
ncbi:hypothetical protein Tco_0189909 [Tanacetum coccineum]